MVHVSAQGEKSSKLCTGGIRFPSFLNWEHLWCNPTGYLKFKSSITLICLPLRRSAMFTHKVSFGIIKYPSTDYLNDTKFNSLRCEAGENKLGSK